MTIHRSISRSAASPREDSSDELLRLAVEDLDAGRALRARRRLASLIAADQAGSRAWHSWLRTHQVRNDLPAALDELDRLEAEWPDSALVAYARGHAQRRLSALPAAVESFRVALARDPGCHLAAGELGFVEHCLGLDGGRERIEAALDGERADGHAWGEGAALNSLANVAWRLGEFAWARELYEAALVIFRELPDGGGQASVLANLGTIHYRLFDFAAARRCYEEAAAHYQACGDHFGAWNVIGNLGFEAYHFKDMRAARTHLRHALRLERKLDPLQLAPSALAGMAQVSNFLGRHERADELYAQVLADRSTPPHVRIGCLQARGGLARQAGDLEAEGRWLEAALRLARKRGDREREIHVRLSLAERALLRTDRPRSALAQACRAVALAQELSAGLSAPYFRAVDAQLELAQAEAALGRVAAAWESNLVGLDLTDRLFVRQAQPDLQAGLIELVRGLIEGAVELTASPEFARVTGLDPDRAGLEIAERGRARVLRQLLLGSTGTAELPTSLRRRKESAEKTLRRLHARRLSARTPAARKRLDTPLEEAKRRLEDTLRACDAHHAAGEAERLDLDRLQAGIPENTAVVAYLVGERESVAWVLRHDRLTTVRLPVDRDRLGRWLTTLLAPLRSVDASTPLALLTERHRMDLAHRLYRVLVAPLQDELETADHLVVVPDGLLHELPFELLTPDRCPDEHDPGDCWRRHRYLVERWTVQTSPSLALIGRRQRSGRRASKGLLVVAADQGVRVPTTGEELPPLPAAARESKAIARDTDDAELLLGDDATKPALVAAAPHHRQVHVIAHAVLDERAPDLSGIVLADDGDSDVDPVLRAHEIAGLRLAAELVVLSACRSGAGELRTGEGLLGLRRAFQRAGAAATIASLWNASDEVGRLLFPRFHRALGRGASRAEALAEVKRALIARGREKGDVVPGHPACWATHVLQDDRLD
ncbi:MAG: CHAT domain-containing tetratricopeptide repeat protein [Acidobacteriota bacterium]